MAKVISMLKNMLFSFINAFSEENTRKSFLSFLMEWYYFYKSWNFLVL